MGIKEYTAALSQEVLPAFRRGVIAVTILAYLVIVGAFVFLGWHLNFTTLQLWTGALLIAGLEVLIVLPYRLWKSNRAIIEELNQRLTALGQDRPLAFQNVQFKTYVNKKTKTCNITATVYFANNGDRMLKWRMLSCSIEANGHKAIAPAATSDYFVNRGQQCWYNYATLQNAPFNGWPVTVDVMFDCEYDNVPPLKIRGTKRINRYVLPALNAQNITSFDLFSEER
jgi:hypothetical protein